MRLVDYFTPVMARVAAFVQNPDAGIDAFDAEISAALDMAQMRAQSQGIPTLECKNALFAVCAWVDETLMRARLQGFDLWPSRMLQQRYFNTTRAGIQFFERLDNLSSRDLELREVFLICLTLGFQGKYALKGMEAERDALIRQQVNNYIEVSGASIDLSKGLLFPSAYISDQAALSMRKKWWYRIKAGSIPLWVYWLPLIFIIIVLVYLAFSFSLDQVTNSLNHPFTG
jgi:type VI secretion system protein ImpK